MPGNEIGERVHNFFGQENFSQGQHHLQAVDRNWPGLSDNLWAGNQRQIGAPLITNLKNQNAQQSESEAALGGQSSPLQHGFRYTQPSLSPEFDRNHSQNQLPITNGYMHGHHQVFQTRQNEANFLGVDTESDRHNLTSRGLSILESQLRNGPDLQKNLAWLEPSESPVNYDFFGGQQQMSSQHVSNFQSMPGLQPGISDMQLQQRQAMLKMQELQRRQQLQQQKQRQQTPVNQVTSSSKQAADNHSPSLINGIPFHEVSHNSWQPDVMATNTNWLQHGAPPVMQTSSGKLMVSSEQGRGNMTGLTPQHHDQYLYGVPISGTMGTSSQYSHIQMDKTEMQQISACSDSLPGSQYAAFSDQVSIQGEQLVSRQGFQGRNMFGPSSVQGASSGQHLENLPQVNPPQRNTHTQEFYGRQDLTRLSETSQMKGIMKAAPAPTVATLDPTEEKILFGDDNMWDAFGGGTGGYNMLDGTDISGAFPSMQSGKWSALMQSAVAETCSGDIGPPEEQSGFSFQNPQPLKGNQRPSTGNDSRKQQSGWGDSNLQAASTLNPRAVSQSDDANSSINYSNYSGVQQPVFMPMHEHNDRLQTGSSHRFIQQFSEEGREQLQKQTEGNRTYGEVAHSSDTESNAKSILGSWSHHQSIPSYEAVVQPVNKQNGWNFIESMTSSGATCSKNCDNENPSQPSHSSDCQRAVHEEMSHIAGLRNINSVPNSTDRLGNVRSSTESTMVNREHTNLNKVSATPYSSTATPNKESSQQLPNSRNLEFWKRFNPSLNSKGSEVSGKLQHHLDSSPKILESSGNNGSPKGTVEMHELENFNKKEISNESFHSNVSHHTSASGLRENIWLDASDSRTAGKQKSSGNVGRRPGTRKFQYHPMGNVDVDLEHCSGTQNIMHSQTMPQQAFRGLNILNQGYLGQSKFSGQLDRNSMEMDKSRGPSFEGHTKGLEEVPLKSTPTSYAPNASAPVDRFGNFVPTKTAPSSQNMLELLHKVDQPGGSGSGAHLYSSDRNLSLEMPEPETSDGSFGNLQQNQSSASQGFGLQLAPPSQRLPIMDRGSSSQSSSQTVNSLSLTNASCKIGDKGNTLSAPTASAQSSPSHETYQGEYRNNLSGISGEPSNNVSGYNIRGKLSNTLASGFPYGRSHIQNQHMTVTSAEVTTNPSVSLSSDRLASLPKQMEYLCQRAQNSQSALVSGPVISRNTPYNDFASSAEASQQSATGQNHGRDSSQHVSRLEAAPATWPSVSAGMSQQTAFSEPASNLWTSVSNQQRLLGVQSNKAPSNMFKSNFQLDSKLQKGGNDPSEFGVGSANLQSFVGEELQAKESPWQRVSSEDSLAQKMTSGSQEEDYDMKHPSDITLPTPGTTQRDIEAFGRSLKPNNKLHQSYSLLDQVRTMRSTENGPSNRSMERFEGPESGLDTPYIVPKGGQQASNVRDPPMGLISSPSGDSKMLRFLSNLGNQDTGSSPQDMFAFGPIDAKKLTSAASSSGDHSQISPQMAPSWFDQYGTFKKGQMLQVNDAQKFATANTMEQPCITRRVSDNLHDYNSTEQANGCTEVNQLCNVQKSIISKSISGDHFSSAQLLPPDDVSDQNMIMRPKKRKTDSFKLVAWHKEVTQGGKRLQNISLAEADWAQTANRLIEKVVDEAELVEDGPPMYRPKRRLILTTQLMQQLLRPPPAKLLSANADSEFESMAYFVARLALGDACSTVSFSRSDTPLPSDRGNILSETFEASRTDDHCFLKVTEDFIGRAKTLESEFLRLDKSASILDSIIESQEQEKISVINRFAKFHSRGQADGAEADPYANPTRSFPQRYVTGFPLPKNLPDGVQCLSL